MNFTLKQLQQRVNNLIEEQGEDAYCGAWIYTKEDCFLTDENGEQEYVPVVEVSTNLPTSTFFVYCYLKFKKFS